MTERKSHQRSTPRQTLEAYARGAVGGLLVGMPSFMTMEIWWGGFVLAAERLLDAGAELRRAVTRARGGRRRR